MRNNRGEGRDPITGLTPPHFCTRLKPRLGFPASYVVRGLVAVGDVDDHYCLNFFFSILP